MNIRYCRLYYSTTFAKCHAFFFTGSPLFFIDIFSGYDIMKENTAALAYKMKDL